MNKKSLSQYQNIEYVKQGQIVVNSFLATALPASSSMGIISANFLLKSAPRFSKMQNY